MKRIISTVKTLIVLSIFAGTAQAVDTITWSTTPTFRAFESDGTTLLSGNASSSIAGFVQLLYLGSDGLYNGFTASGSGVVGDDVAVQTTWVGNGVMLFPAGQFLNQFLASSAIGSKYEIRFFNTPSSNYAGGAAPTTGNYGLSQVFTQTGDPAANGLDAFSFNQNYSATVAVPEPSTVALMLAGLGVLGITRMRRKS